MAKAKKVSEVTENAVESQEINNGMPLTHESAIPAEPAKVYTEESEEVIAKRAEIVSLEASLKDMVEAVKAKKTEIKDLTKAVNAMLKGEKVKVASSHKFVFISNGQNPKEMKTIKGKPLSYQGQLLLQMFIGNAEAGTELSYTREEIIAKLEADYPCLGDKMDNFSWYKSQVFKPMGLVK